MKNKCMVYYIGRDTTSYEEKQNNYAKMKHNMKRKLFKNDEKIALVFNKI